MVLEKNAGKKIKEISNDQWIEVMEQSVEFFTLNDRLAKKIILRDLIRKKINDQSISELFADAEWEVNDKLPKLAHVLARMFVKVKFMKALAQFNSASNSKVQFTVHTLMSSLIKFVHKVMKMDQNGYKGYKYKVQQVDASHVAVKKVANEEDKIPVVLQFEIEHLDWETIKKEETEEVFTKYSRVLNIYIMVTNKESNQAQIFQVDIQKSMQDVNIGKMMHKVTLHLPKVGNNKFEYMICDNFGFNYIEPILIKAEKGKN